MIEQEIRELLKQAPRVRRRPLRVTFMVTQAELDMMKVAADNQLYEGDISKLIRTILHEKLDHI